MPDRPSETQVNAILAVPVDERVMMVAEDPSVLDVLAAEVEHLRNELAAAEADAHQLREALEEIHRTTDRLPTRLLARAALRGSATTKEQT